MTVAITLVLLLLSSARAEIKNFTFYGTIGEVADQGFVLDGSITNGAAFEGFYIFDSAAADSNSDPTVGDYRFTNSTFGVVLKVGSSGFFLSGTVNSISEAPTVIPERPGVTLSEAVEVRWPSRLGYFYQVQSWGDLETWTNVGEPVLGDGTELSRFFARQPGKNTYYRAEIANFPK